MKKDMKNAPLKAALTAAGIELTETPVIIEIGDAKNGKKKLFCAAKVELPSDPNGGGMSAFEAMAQGLDSNNLQRGLLIATPEVIAENELTVGKPLVLKTPEGKPMAARLKVIESHKPFYSLQKPISYEENGERKNKLKGGKPFYRTTQVVPVGQDRHQLLSNLEALTK